MAKRPNRFAFPTAELDSDVAMSDASSEPDLLTPLSIPEHPFHAHERLASNASSTSASELSSLENSPASSRESSLPPSRF